MISYSTLYGFHEFVASSRIAARILLAGKFDTRVAFHEDSFCKFHPAKGEVDDGDDTRSLNGKSLSPPPFILAASFDSSNGSYDARLPAPSFVEISISSKLHCVKRKRYSRSRRNFIRKLISDPCRVSMNRMKINANYFSIR